jgi:hypothetical protein
MASVPKVYGGSDGRLQSVIAVKPSRKRVQEGSAVESTSTRMERVLGEL